MNTLAISTPHASNFPDIAREFWRREPLFTAAALLLLVLAVPTAVAGLLDERTLAAQSVWSKPLKFEASLSIYLLTLAWFAGYLPEGTTGRRWYRVYSALVVFMIAIEMVWLMGAAAAGAPSHFNREGGLLEAVYPLMGVFAVGLTSATLVYGRLIARDGDAGLGPAFRSAVSIGLTLTFFLTIATAGYLASGEGHLVGREATDARGVPLLGWATSGGDLRVAHFFATHAMHFIPGFGLLCTLLAPNWGVLAVRLFSATYAVFVGAVLFQAAMGSPFLG